jgi:hypothetical protein
MWGVSPIDQLWCRIQFRQYRYEGIFTPQTAEGQGSRIFPGQYGVFELLSHRVPIAAPNTRLLHARRQIDQSKRFIDTGGPQEFGEARAKISLGQRRRSFRAARVSVPKGQAIDQIGETVRNEEPGKQEMPAVGDGKVLAAGQGRPTRKGA